MMMYTLLAENHSVEVCYIMVYYLLRGSLTALFLRTTVKNLKHLKTTLIAR